MYKHIKELRKAHGLKQRELAGYLKCCQKSYSNYERGKTGIPLDILIELSKFYGTSVDYLLDLTEEKTPHLRKDKKKNLFY